MKSLLALAAIACSFSLLGCAATPVALPLLRPAEIDVAGVRRIAVPDFRGAAPYAEQARGELCAAMAGSQLCDIPPPHIVREMIPAIVPYQGQPLDMQLVLEQALRAGFDAVLLGEVVCETNAQQSFIVGNPRIEARIATQLIDTHTGQIRGETKTATKWRGELSRLENAPNTQRKVTERLVLESTRKAAAKLATTTVHIDVVLAAAGHGDDQAAIEAGSLAAEAGDWALAAQHFERALEANGQSHAAMYNLGLACEAQYNFAAARHWHTEAVKLHEADEYRDALTRVDRSWRDYDLAMRQLQPRSESQFAHRPAPSPIAPVGWQR